MSERRLFAGALLFQCVAGVAVAAERPVAVSPGDTANVALIEDRCPTFIWGGVEEASIYELVVYRVGERGEETKPILTRQVPGSANGWTPALDACLDRGGQYAWTVRAQMKKATSEWSAPNFFEVTSGPSQQEFEAALATVQQYLAARGAPVTAAPESARVSNLSPAEDSAPRSASSASAQLIPEPPATVSLVTEGAVGIGTSTPLADLHILGDSTTAGIVVGTSERGTSELFLASDPIGDFGMRLKWDGTQGVNSFQILGRSLGVDGGPLLSIERPTGAATFSGVISGDGSGLTNLDSANLAGPVALDKGGTGATDAPTARTNLGAAAAQDLDDHEADAAAHAPSGWTSEPDKVYLANTWDNVGIGTSNPQARLSVGGNGYLNATIYGETYSNRAIQGHATFTGTGTSYGGYFQAASSYGRAVYGEATASGNVTNYGGEFIAYGDAGIGVQGSAPGTDGRGVSGWATGENGRGVYGLATMSNGIGVYGRHFSNGKAVVGEATDATATFNYGGAFTAAGSFGRGVYGYASGADGVGGYFGGGSKGVYGSANNIGDVPIYGAYFETFGGQGTGVYGQGNLRGGFFETEGTDAQGVLGRSTGAGGVGVWGVGSGGKPGKLGGSDFAVKAEGDLVVEAGGAYRGDIGPNNGAPFPRPAYDSGWVSVSCGTENNEARFEHYLGGNKDNYVVSVDLKGFITRPSGELVIHNFGMGSKGPLFLEPFDDSGVWYGYDEEIVSVLTGVIEDDFCPYVETIRVRIWVVK